MVSNRGRFSFPRRYGKNSPTSIYKNWRSPSSNCENWRSPSSQCIDWRSPSSSSSSSKECVKYNRVLCCPLAHPTLPPTSLKDLPRPTFSRKDLAKIMAAKLADRPYAFEPSFFERILYLLKHGREGLILLPSDEPQLEDLFSKLIDKHSELQRSLKAQNLENQQSSSRTPTISPLFAPSKSLFNGKITHEYVR